MLQDTVFNNKCIHYLAITRVNILTVMASVKYFLLEIQYIAL